MIIFKQSLLTFDVAAKMLAIAAKQTKYAKFVAHANLLVAKANVSKSC